MRIKRFYFETIKEGIEEIKKRFGPEALILDIKKNGNGADTKGFEISIAIEDGPIEEGDSSGILRKRLEALWDEFQFFLRERIQSLETEFIKERIRNYPLTLRIYFDRMVSNGVDKGLALLFISEVFSEIGGIAEDSLKANYFLKYAIGKRIKLVDIRDGEGPILIIGPSGAGKTETVKKVAGYLKEEGEDLSIVAYDPLKKGAYDDFMSFSKERKISLSFTINEEEVLSLIGSNGRKKRLIDLSGDIGIQKGILKRFKEAKKIAVFEASTRLESIKAYLELLEEKELYGIVFTKIDEESSLGHLVTYIATLKIPVLFFTKGLEIGDIVFPSEETLLRLLLERNPWRKGKEP